MSETCGPEEAVPRRGLEYMPRELVLYSPGEVGKMLGLTGATICKYARDGQLEAVRIGQSVRFSYAAVREFIRRNESLPAEVARRAARNERG